jgi:HEPN domain-containing protein
MTREDVIRYWVESSEVDFRAMESLFENGHYVWALFVGHLVTEKLLKALYVRNVDTNAPRIHDLLKLGTEAGLGLSDDQRTFLDAVTSFNIKARYPDKKHKFYERASQGFAAEYVRRIKEFRQWLLEQISS